MFVFQAGKETESPDRHVGGRAGPGVPGERSDVPAVRGRAVGAAPDREGKGETREGEEGLT